MTNILLNYLSINHRALVKKRFAVHYQFVEQIIACHNICLNLKKTYSKSNPKS